MEIKDHIVSDKFRLPIFGVTIHWHLAGSPQDYKVISRYLEGVAEEDANGVKQKHEDSEAFVCRNGYNVHMAFRRKPEQDTLSHESLHAAMFTLDAIGCLEDKRDEEVVAYILGYIAYRLKKAIV